MSICVAFVVAGRVFQRLALISFLGTIFSSRPDSPLLCVLDNHSYLCKVGIKYCNAVKNWDHKFFSTRDKDNILVLLFSAQDSLLNPFNIVTKYLQFGKELHLFYLYLGQASMLSVFETLRLNSCNAAYA